MYALTNKIAIITGGAAGIGRATSLLLARAGASVAVVDLDEPNGSALVREIVAAGSKAMFIRADVSRAAEGLLGRLPERGAGNGRGLGRRGHPVQQRRHHPPRHAGRIQRRGLGSRDGGQHQVHVFAVLYLASEAASFITGAILAAEGLLGGWRRSGGLIIDPAPVSFYNTNMICLYRYSCGFFRPDHDPPYFPAL